MKINLNITQTIKDEQAILDRLQKQLKKLPQENICCRKRKGRYRYCIKYKTIDGKIHEKYVSGKEHARIQLYSEAAYLKKLIPALEREIKSLKHLEVTYKPEEKIEAWLHLSEGLRFTEVLFKSKKEICNDWEYSSFNSNPFPINDTGQYITKKGEVVRSRIELIVADLLYDLGIPYRYECKLSLPSGNIYPDFTIMHPETLELYYVEIFGMMDNPEYERSAFAKIAKYSAADLYSHLLMFFDHKNAPISPVNIKKTLESVFL